MRDVVSEFSDDELVEGLESTSEVEEVGLDFGLIFELVELVTCWV